ncbi:hypothetical protein K435DRAFT_877060 [Dendrothele bispora CBS 962.96]|uniref:Uncharacterized protein n=1 Tax=Dendrothele bispora (strain CBS 962.96) TaxID=1314807 RepID=A0A4S8KRR1_DENBC|nr:hypothetical protein K435DRAFT_877060 [Dendrothele bispora CBS 962.96]
MYSAGLAHSVLFCPELFRLIVAHGDFFDFLAWYATCSTMQTACGALLLMDFRDLLVFWCANRSDVSSLMQQMDATETVAIGAVALAVLRLQSLNPLSALHLVAPLESIFTWTIVAGRLGWIRCGRSGSSNLRMIWFVTCKNTLITLTFVKSRSAVEFVPKGPETALVNFVCPSGVFCGYPSLTFNKVTFALQDNENGFRVGWDCLRGFRYDGAFVESKFGCLAKPRSWSDNRSFSLCWSDGNGVHCLPVVVMIMSLLRICDDPSLFLNVLMLLPFKTWISIAFTNRYVQMAVRNCFCHLMHTRLLAYMPEERVPPFFTLLTETNAVVVGALPLAMLGLLSWDPSKELVIYCPIEEKRKWVRRFRWKLFADKKGGDSVNGIDSLQQFRSPSGGTVNIVYVQGPRVLDVLAKAPETALSTCLTGSTLVVAYPLMTLNRQTFTVVMTRGGHVIGGECLDDFVPIALADRMPRRYVGVRSWGDGLCMRFEYGMSWPADLNPLSGGFTWDLSAT